MLGIKVILHKKVKSDLRVLPEISHLYEQITAVPIHDNKAVVGSSIFNLEASISQISSGKQAFTYEAYNPEMVGRKRHLVIGKHSDKAAVEIKLKEKGIELERSFLPEIVESIRNYSESNRRSLTDEEFLHIVQEVSIGEKAM